MVRLGVDVPYEQAWELQRRVHARRLAGEIGDVCLLLEHAPVYTAGRRTLPAERPADGTPVIDVDRGGKIAWHGPGQLVVYPIVRLTGEETVLSYVRRLERALVRICADFGVTATQVAGRNGAWVRGEAARGLPDRQVGAVGIRVTGGVTMHGFSINCANDLTWYNRITPCGVAGAGVTSLSAETGRRITVDEVTPVAEKRLAEALDAQAVELPEEELYAR